jgi:hypothetical protein
MIGRTAAVERVRRRRGLVGLGFRAVAEPGIAHATGEQKRAKKKLHENDPSFKA